MKTFEDLKKETPLKRFIENEFGTLYIQQDYQNGKDAIIRHFDKEVLPEFIPTYILLYDELVKWIDSKPDIKEYVFIPKLLEVGDDYTMRSFYVYYNHIRSYTDEYEPIVPPSEYYGMINMVSYELSEDYEADNYLSNEENIIHRIIRKSLLGGTGKTFFDDELQKFIIVEPKISITDLQEWKQKKEAKA
ncbi:hypothetical protein [Flavobacterium pedocola]